MENNEAVSDLEAAIKSDKVQDLTTDMLDAGLDSLIKIDLLKDIPYLKFLTATHDVYTAIRDKHMIKKILHFLFQTKELSQEEKNNFLFKLYDDSKYKNNFFEKLVILLDRLDDTEKATIIGNLFVAMVKDIIPIIDFFKLAFIVDSIYIIDLKAFYCKYGHRIYRSHAWNYNSFVIYYSENNLDAHFASFAMLSQKIEDRSTNLRSFVGSENVEREYKMRYSYNENIGLGKLFIENGFDNIKFPELKKERPDSEFFK